MIRLNPGPRAVVLLLATCALQACGSERSPDDDAPRWALAETLRIGSAAGEGPEAFGYVNDVMVDALGRVWVADGQWRVVRVFDTEGRFVREVGAPGEGPGELGLPMALEAGPDGNVWVADSGNGRWEVFDSAGVYVDSHPYAPGMYRFGDRWGDEGLLNTWVAVGGGPSPRFVIVRRRLSGRTLVPVDTLPVPDVESGRVVPVAFERDGRRMNLMVPLPFQSVRERLLLPGAGWWISHPGPRYRLARLNTAGDTVAVLERPFEPVPVTPADIDEALARLPDGTEFPRGDIPDAHSPVSGLLALPDGHLLVRRRAARGEVFEIFDPAGEYRGALPVPEGRRLSVHAATDDALYGVVQGELDEPYVVRFDIRRNP